MMVATMEIVVPEFDCIWFSQFFSPTEPKKLFVTEVKNGRIFFSVFLLEDGGYKHNG